MGSDLPARAAVRAWLLSGQPPAPPGPPAAALVSAAAAQGLAGLLDGAAARSGRALPPDLAQPLRRAHLGAVAASERHLGVARRALDLLAAEGLRALPLKGAAVAGWLYDSPGERPMGDVDVLALDDWERSRRALERAGYVEQERADHARSYRAPESGVIVELHHSVTSCPGLFPCDAGELWARRVDGPAGPRPSAEHLLVQLALHAAFQHGLAVRLIQYVDLRRLVERGAADPARVVALSRAGGAGAAVALALEAAALLVEAPVPRELRAALAPALPAGLRRWLEAAGRAPERLLEPERPPLARVRWALARGRRLRLLARTLDPREPGERAGWGRPRRVAGRALGLARRWALRPGD